MLNGNAFSARFLSSDAANLDTGTAIFREDPSVKALDTTNFTSAGNPINVILFDSGTAIGDVVLETVSTGADVTFGGVANSGLTSTFRGDLTVISADAVLDNNAGTDNTLVVLGDTSISATTVLLDQTSNDYQGVVRLSGGDATIADTDSIVLGSVDLTGGLTVTAGSGSITDTASEGISVAGTTSLVANSGDVILDNDDIHDFGTVSASAATTVEIDDVDDIVIGDITATTFTLAAGGNVTQIVGSTINVSGATSFDVTGGGINLSGGNDFTTVQGSAGSLVLNESDGVVVTGFTATAGDVSITSDADVTVADATVLSATGNIALISTGAGAVSAVSSAQIIADSNNDDIGNLTMTSQGGVAGGGTGSLLRGAAVTISGGSVTSSTLRSTVGDIDIDATSGTYIASGQTTAAAGLLVGAATGITLHDTSAANMVAAVTSGSIGQTTGRPSMSPAQRRWSRAGRAILRWPKPRTTSALCGRRPMATR